MICPSAGYIHAPEWSRRSPRGGGEENHPVSRSGCHPSFVRRGVARSGHSFFVRRGARDQIAKTRITPAEVATPSLQVSFLFVPVLLGLWFSGGLTTEQEEQEERGEDHLESTRVDNSESASGTLAVPGAKKGGGDLLDLRR